MVIESSRYQINLNSQFPIKGEYQITIDSKNNLYAIDRKKGDLFFFKHGNLEKWHNNKIFLLNTSLTVLPNKSGSHIKIWEEFINKIIKFIIEKNDKCIFLLLGNNSKKKKKIINDENRIIECVHPSPLSCYNGFFNSNIFKKIEEKINETINWEN